MSLRPARRVSGVQRTLIRQIFDSAPADAINLGLGQPDLPTPPALALAGIEAICQGKTGYTSTAGDLELRRQIAASYPGLAEGPQNVAVTVGTQEALFASCLTLCDPGEAILYPDPGYPAYAVVARLIGARAVPYRLRPEERFRPRAEEIERRLEPDTRLVILSSPSNPTGATFDPGELPRILALLQERGVAWISDEIYGAYRYDGDSATPASLGAGGGLVISGLSKDMSMTGWRVGWVVGEAAILERIIASHQYLVTCASSISQYAARSAFGTWAAAERARRLERFGRRRELMAAELRRIPDVSFDLPDGAFYFFVNVARHGDSLELARRILAAQNVVTIPGEAFGDGGRGFLRLSFAAEERAIVEGIGRIRKELTGG